MGSHSLGSRGPVGFPSGTRLWASRMGIGRGDDRRESVHEFCWIHRRFRSAGTRDPRRGRTSRDRRTTLHGGKFDLLTDACYIEGLRRSLCRGRSRWSWVPPARTFTPGQRSSSLPGPGGGDIWVMAVREYSFRESGLGLRDLGLSVEPKLGSLHSSTPLITDASVYD